ncbi:hypothetical protein QAD02_017235 [Eretmocerus hayati]|uniref:Uncharacterized protein n=1 Tax=Eretmocerus hayati TaxID=131215 RepID=A0ACC2PEF0_9HYME|nr:hypothetical protein QAD02_017235 [Eretmocerus hayati]
MIQHKKSIGCGSASIEQRNANGSGKSGNTGNNGSEIGRDEDQDPDKKKPIIPGIVGGSVGGPLLQQMEVSSSQLDFFKMLDEKIESGPDLEEAGGYSGGLAPPGLHATAAGNSGVSGPAGVGGSKHSLRRAHRVTGLLEPQIANGGLTERRHSLRELARLDGLEAMLAQDPLGLVATTPAEPIVPLPEVPLPSSIHSLDASSQSPTLRPYAVNDT